MQTFRLFSTLFNSRLRLLQLEAPQRSRFRVYYVTWDSAWILHALPTSLILLEVFLQESATPTDFLRISCIENLLGNYR